MLQENIPVKKHKLFISDGCKSAGMILSLQSQFEVSQISLIIQLI